MAMIKLKRGLASNITSLTLEQGEPAFTTDTKKLYIGQDGTTTKTLINPDVASAPAADKLTTARNFNISGDGVAPNVPFDGTGDVTLILALANSGVTAGQYTKVTVNAKGLITSATTLTAADIPSLTLAKITDAGTAASKNTGIASGNVPVLNANGQLDGAVIPAIAITDTFVVASQAAMLALSTAEVGDVAVRTDINKTFILKVAGYATLANWQELLTPTDTVLSVNGKTGAITLTATDVGAEPTITAGTAAQYWNGSKIWTDFATTARAVILTGLSTATSTVVAATDSILTAIGKLQAQITLRATLVSPTFTGTPAAPTATTGTNTTQIATTAFVNTSMANAVIDGGTF